MNTEKLNHTPGPWHISTDVPEKNIYGVYGKDIDRGLSNVNSFTVWLREKEPNEEEMANIKLISAAPDLLDACIKAINIVDLWAPKYSEEKTYEENIAELAALSMMRQAIEQAIQKATK